MQGPNRYALFFGLFCSFFAGCGDEGVPHARKAIRQVHAREVAGMIRDDIDRHRRGIARVADRLAPGFEVQGPEREAQMRSALRVIDEPRRGVGELVASPKTFLAAVDVTGIVIARDAGRDHTDAMRGLNLGEKFAVVKDALAGKNAYGIEQFDNTVEGGEPSVTLVFAAPARRNGAIVGVAMLGIPLWRLEQRISRQLQLDHQPDEPGLILWSYVYRGDALYFAHGAHPDLDTIAPNADERRAGLRASPGGFTLQKNQYDRWYAFGVLPIPTLGPDTGVVIVRSDPL